MPPFRVLCRAAFVLFALAVVTATHWPRLQIEGPVARTDLVLHLATFFLWTWLLIGCAFFGPALSRRNTAISALTALAYSMLDEITQGIPGLGRHVALDDALANAGGVTAAFLSAVLVARLRSRARTGR